jgi:tetratricopeptide (TPR) repeat protein
MRVKIKEKSNNQIKIILKNDIDKNFNFSIIATIVFVFICFIVYAVEISNYSDANILKKADENYLTEQYFTAVKYYARAFKINPNRSAEVSRDYSMSLIKLANYDLAIKHLKTIQEAYPENSEDLYNLAYAIYSKAKQTGDNQGYMEAANYLESAVNLDKEMEKSYLLMGLCYRGAGLYDKARATYNRAAGIQTFSRSVFYNLIGHTFAENEEYRQAAEYYKMSIAADQSNMLAYLNLGNVYSLLNETELALDNYKKSIEFAGDFVVPYVKIGELYMNSERYYEAIQWLSQALKVNPEHADASYMIAIAYQKTDRQKEMIDYLKKAARLGSDQAVYKLKEIGIDLKG